MISREVIFEGAQSIGALGCALVGAWLLVSTSGCSLIYDATVLNPCAVPLRVETHNVRTDDLPTEPAYRSVTLPSGSKTKIEQAYDWGDHDEWSVRVIGVPGLLPEAPGEWDGDTLLLPRSVCATPYSPPVEEPR